jgi:hypothetical protein
MVAAVPNLDISISPCDLNEFDYFNYCFVIDANVKLVAKN